MLKSEKAIKMIPQETKDKRFLVKGEIILISESENIKKIHKGCMILHQKSFEIMS
jgi:hypothetical protein